MITIQDASIYSMQGEMAYQLTYSDGYTFRAVVGKEIIRAEYLNKVGKWEQGGKPYKIEKNKKRQNERVVESVKEFLK